MLNYYLVLLFVSFFVLSGLLIFCSQHKHLLVTLLSLEYLMLSIFTLFMASVNWEASEGYFSLIFLIFAVSEGVLGLSVLVVLARSHGSDFFKSFNLVW